MARSVSYRIVDRPDGLFDAVATLAPDRTHRREGFASLAAAEAWVEGLRLLMAAIGAPLVRADAGPPDAMPEEARRGGAVAVSDAPPVSVSPRGVCAKPKSALRSNQPDLVSGRAARIAPQPGRGPAPVPGAARFGAGHQSVARPVAGQVSISHEDD